MTRTALLAAALWVPLLGSAYASESSQASAAPDEAQTTTLTEVVITAQKRSESLQDVPIAVAVVNADQLDAVGVDNVQDLKMLVAGIEVQSNNGYALPVLRGVGSKATGPGIENPIAIYVDGVYHAAATATILELNNIRQIEVLRGPQGTLFGRNATGGLIQITTKDPRAEFGGQVSLSGGNYDTFRGSVYLNGGIATNLAADLAVVGTTMGRGYGRNLFDGSDVYRIKHNVSARSKWLWTPAASTEARLILDYSDSEDSMNAQRVPIGATVPAPYGPAYAGDKWDTNVDAAPLIRTKGGGVSLRVDHSFEVLELVSISAYRDFDFASYFDLDYTPALGRIGDVAQNDRQFSQEIQLLSPVGERASWVLGAYYFNGRSSYDPAKINFLGVAQIPSPAGNFIRSTILSQQDIDSKAVFGEAKFGLTEQLRATVGVRYTSEDRDSDGTIFITRINGEDVVAFPRATQSATFDKVTWRAAIDYKLSNDAMAYLSYNRGFKSGGFNPSAFAIPSFSPEILDAYELGLKSESLSRRLRFNVAAYYYDYQDVQVLRVVNAASGIYNGGGARIYGMDADVEALVTADFNVRFGYQYAHGRYTDFPGAVNAVPRPEGGVTLSTTDAAGNWTVLTPEHSVSVVGGYLIPLAGSELAVNVGYYYNSGFFHEPDNLLRQSSYDLVNASVQWKSENGWSVALWGNNLTEEAVANVNGIQSLGATGVERIGYAPPRTYGVTLGLSF